ncbi:MAG: carbamoyltransferase [Pseudomonadota bacterium]
MNILGVSAFYHDSAAALVVAGRIAAAAQEERFTRLKHDARFPEHAITYCLEAGGLALDQLDAVVFFEKPFLKFERLLETYVEFAPRGFSQFRRAIPLWVREKLFQKSSLLKSLNGLGRGELARSRLWFSEHHLSHAASAFYPSPFDEAAVLTMDGVGEWATTTCALGQGESLQVLREIHFPHSLGLLYSAFTYYCGFRVNSGEYTLLGRAPFGKPRFADRIRSELIDIKPDGSFALAMKYFDYCTGLTMTRGAFHDLFEGLPRDPESPIERRHMDLAASIQAVTEDVVLALARDLREQSGQSRLCLAGGVALNCVANGKLRAAGIYDEIYVQPAAGDAGGSLGAALQASYSLGGVKRRVAKPDGMSAAALGPEFDDAAIEAALREAGAVYEQVDEPSLLASTAQALAAGEAVGWFQGRMEFGPRALGRRSILADPRDATTQRNLNLKIKFRESFRPFAPAVMADRVGEWFSADQPSPYMLMVDQVHPAQRRKVDGAADGLAQLSQERSTIPAVTHVDGSARVQTVAREDNRLFYELLAAFDEQTGCPVLVNTSFNIRGEPIVCTPQDAWRCFMGTDLDRLVIGRFVLQKAAQPAQLRADYRDEFALD